MLVESARGVSTEFVERSASGGGCAQSGGNDCGHSEGANMERTTRPTVEACLLLTFTARTMTLLR